LLGGFRTVHLEEGLVIADNVNPLTANALTFLGNPVLPGSSVTDTDSFRTSNQFYGVNLGGRMRWQYDWFFVNAYGKVALGVTEEKVHIQGSTALSIPTGTQTTVGGILAQQSNIGNYNRNTFGVVPEGGLTFGVEAMKNVRLMAGYSVLYWNRVARPGLTIDRVVGPGQVPTDQAFGRVTGNGGPTFRFNDASFWAQSLNAGIEIYY
jgi:hypothetical protein